MPIEFRCSQCGKLLRTGDDTAGKQARCPACGNVLPVPARSQAAIGVSSPFSPSSGFAPGQAVGGSPFATAPAAQFSPGSENPYQSPGIYVGPSSGWDGSVGFELAGRGARLAGATIDGLITVASIVPAYVTLFLFESGNGNAAD
ncbi:MAG TPA: zinc ribbon domain-containing protein, partial [Pirellulales bacterium]|nr:zinc ribbon domain-containing protein [Pirellulales bacterium]